MTTPDMANYATTTAMNAARKNTTVPSGTGERLHYAKNWSAWALTQAALIPSATERTNQWTRVTMKLPGGRIAVAILLC